MALLTIKKKSIEKGFKISVLVGVIGFSLGCIGAVYQSEITMVFGGITALLGLGTARAIKEVFQEKLEIEILESSDSKIFKLENLIEVETE